MENKIDNRAISKIELLNRNITKKLDNLMKVSLFFYNNKNSNMSLIEKYINTEEIKKSGPFFIKAFKIFKVNKPLSNYIYSDLKDACNSILDSDTCLYFIKCRRFIDNDIFNCLITPLDYGKLEVSLSKLEELIIDVHKYRLLHSKYSEDFFDEMLNNNDIDEVYILSLSNLINFKYNYMLLSKNKKKRWFNFFNKSSTLDEEYNLNLYHNNQKDIYEEYIYNFNIIKALNSNLLFLKDNFKEENYNEIIRSLIRDDNLKETLLFYKKLLYRALNTKKTFQVINNLPDIEKDILNYCYKYSEKKRDMNLLIKLIPNLKLCLEIEEEEVENLDVIKLYSNYDVLINSICDDVSKRNSLISSYINDLWDDKLKENIDFLYLKEVNMLSEKNILLSKPNNDSLVLNNPDISHDYYKIIYKEIEEYLITKYNVEKVFINTNYIEVYNKDIKLFIKVSPMNYSNTTNNVYEDIHLYNFCKLNNIKFYRVWYRNWWLDKFKELKNIVRVLSQ